MDPGSTHPPTPPPPLQFWTGRMDTFFGRPSQPEKEIKEVEMNNKQNSNKQHPTI